MKPWRIIQMIPSGRTDIAGVEIFVDGADTGSFSTFWSVLHQKQTFWLWRDLTKVIPIGRADCDF